MASYTGKSSSNWNQSTPLSPTVAKCVSLLQAYLKDGQPYEVKEMLAFLKENGVDRKYAYEARKILGIQITGSGRTGSYWSLGPDHAIARKEQPAAARNSDIATSKAPVAAKALKERVADAIPGYDPIVSIAQIANDQTVPIAVRLECHRDVARYTTPQVKATEITSDDQPLALSFKWAS